jgi:VIT1/CCC1 family predicted Fe2+/Mn2+ transporter
MSAHAQVPDDFSPRADQGIEGPSGFAAIVPSIALLVGVLAIIAVVVLGGAIWATVVAAVATVAMAGFVMSWVSRLTAGHDQ